MAIPKMRINYERPAKSLIVIKCDESSGCRRRVRVRGAQTSDAARMMATSAGWLASKWGDDYCPEHA